MFAAPVPAALPRAKWATQEAGGPSYAYVFVLYGARCEQYFLGCMTTAWSLMKLLCVHRRVLLHTPDVPKAVLDIAHATGAFNEIVQTEYIEASEVFFSNPGMHRRFGKIFTKYRVLELRYDKVLFLDADLYVRANLDHLFELRAPAAMVRGPDKPPHGHRIPKRKFVNSGVMLLQPNAALFEEIHQEVTGHPRKLANYNSPDADFLTEHPKLAGEWSSISLEHNFQLEYETLDVHKGTVQFSSTREKHFSEEGKSMPWQQLKVIHFSGAKPWHILLEDVSVLQRPLRWRGALEEKLAEALKEYAQEVATLQRLCAQLQVAEGVLWGETRAESVTLALTAESAKAHLDAHLPAGRWYEHQRSAVWVPEGAAAYIQVSASHAVGDLVRFDVDGVKKEFEVVAIGEAATLLRRQIVLPANWHRAVDPDSECPYYHNVRTSQVQWEFPDLPHHWQAVTDTETSMTYYHDTATGVTRWDPPECEELCRPLEELTCSRSQVVVWRRSFADDVSKLLEAVAAVKSL